MPLQDMFWGDYFGALIDKFGVQAFSGWLTAQTRRSASCNAAHRVAPSAVIRPLRAQLNSDRSTVHGPPWRARDGGRLAPAGLALVASLVEL